MKERKVQTQENNGRSTAEQPGQAAANSGTDERTSSTKLPYTAPVVTTYTNSELLEMMGPARMGGYFNPWGLPPIP